jgi:predicted ATP-grasp superfamily ATP-dependent carboligase
LSKTPQNWSKPSTNLISENGDGAFCVQEYVEGVPASVSLLCNRNAARPLSLNLQDITLAPPDGVSSYNGGIVPLPYPLQQEAFAAAKASPNPSAP